MSNAQTLIQEFLNDRYSDTPVYLYSIVGEDESTDFKIESNRDWLKFRTPDLLKTLEKAEKGEHLGHTDTATLQKHVRASGLEIRTSQEKGVEARESSIAGKGNYRPTRKGADFEHADKARSLQSSLIDICKSLGVETKARVR